MEQINQFISRTFEEQKYIFDASILQNPERYQVRERDGKAVLYIEKISKQAQDILLWRYEIERGFCHQMSYTVLKKLLEFWYVSSGKVYTWNDTTERYKNHSLLVVELQNGTKWIIDGALDVDQCIPVDENSYISRLLVKERVYKAYFDLNGVLHFEIFIEEKWKTLRYEMQETNEDIFYKSVLYSFQNSQRGLVKTIRTKVGEKYDIDIEFLSLWDQVEKLIKQGKAVQVSYF